ncbi:MAG TPA: glycosyltransferase family 2 protein [Candidatus Sulfotelmatobacter sp.]|nr:glycosyltransferase family 2 protein [Candidatus Sulfotelmatobacter sp.]
MSGTRLSICMTTRNRATFIGATLESILCQANEQVEVVVLDGASTDNTEEVVRRYQERFQQLHYVRLEENSGIDRDFAKAVDFSSGEYCWLFSDDDVLKAGAVQIVLDALRADCSLVIINSEVRSADLRTVLEPKRIPCDEDRLYTPQDYDHLLIDIANYLTFIGCVVISRTLWTTRNKEDYFGSYFIHVGVIFQQPLPGDALVIAEPLIVVRYANASWSSRYFEVWMFKWPELIWSFPSVPDMVKARVCSQEPWRNPKRLFLFRAKGSYSQKEYVELLKPRLTSVRERAISRACAQLPGRFANLISFVYRLIFRPASYLLDLSDLANSPFCFWRIPAIKWALIKSKTI